MPADNSIIDYGPTGTWPKVAASTAVNALGAAPPSPAGRCRAITLPATPPAIPSITLSGPFTTAPALSRRPPSPRPGACRSR